MPVAKPARDLDRIMIRLPDGLRERIAERAYNNRRSMTQEVVSMLLQVLENPEEMEINELEAQLRMVQDAFNEQAGVLEGIERRKFELIDAISARQAAIMRRDEKK